ncbi:hypothetical protein KAR91_25725 [Candidatus Pacearchaeota archaeon]|nr:hypothetical protein [Candidatus Pacearchaeota archaeon]
MSRYNLKKNTYKRQSAIEYFKKLLDQEATADLKKVTQKRTLQQNALYWVWLTCIEKETGNPKEQMHLLYRANFLPKSDEQIVKTIIPSLWETVKIQINNYHYFDELADIINIISRHTPDNDTKEMTYYMDSIKDHAKQSMDILLLTKDEKYFIDFINEYQR